MSTHFTLPGTVYLIGAGPGSAKLLTLRALEVLSKADVVFHDDLVSQDVLAQIPARTSVRSVGKRCGMKKVSQEQIHARLIDEARLGHCVVRLKGGDPLIFGRVQEEIQALREAKIEFEIVPGVTAASAAAAAAQIPLTERNAASKLLFVSNHCCVDKTKSQLNSALTEDATVVFYMPGSDLNNLQLQLRASGLQEDSPVLVVSQASCPEQKLIRATLRDLSSLPSQSAPSLLIVGPTVSGAHAENHFAAEETSARPVRWHFEDLRLDDPLLSKPSRAN